MAKHPDYWKIKAALLNLQLIRQQAEATVRASEQSLRLLMQMGSLDPDMSYTMNDVEETLTPTAGPTEGQP